MLRINEKILLFELKDFECQITLHVTFCKVKRSHFMPIHFDFKAQTAFKNLEFDSFLNNSYQTILLRIQKWLGEGSGWIIGSVKDDYINISIFNPLVKTSYIQLPKKLRNSRKGLSIFKTKIMNVFVGVTSDT